MCEEANVMVEATTMPVGDARPFRPVQVSSFTPIDSCQVTALVHLTCHYHEADGRMEEQ